MTKPAKILMIAVIVICAAAWIGGVFLMHESWKTGDLQVSGGVTTVAREMKVDSKTGELREKNFIEAKGGELVLLTLACAAVAALSVLITQKKKPAASESTDA
jgi:hypothetical protein